MHSSHLLKIICAFTYFLFLQSASSTWCADTQTAYPQKWTVVAAVQQALKGNPDAGIARRRIEAAKAAITRAGAAFYPRLDLSAEYGQTNNPIFSFGNILNHGSFTNDINFNDPGTTDNLRLAATVKYRLYNGGRDRAGVHAAKARQQAEEQNRQAVLSILADEVVRSFYTIVQAEEIVEARKSAITAITASLTVAKARYDAGDLLKASLLDIEVQQSSAHEQLIQARHGLNLAKRGFLNLLGLRLPDIDIDIAQQFPQQVPDNPDENRRPEIQRLNALIQAAEEQLNRAKGDYYPTTDLFGSYQVDQGFIDEENSGNSWMAGVKLNYNLYEGSRTEAAVAAATADLARTKEMKRKMGLAITYEIEKAQLALKQAEERLLVTDKQVTLANESARLSRERFREGVILSSSLIDAENRLTDARVHSSLAKAARMIAIADLRRAAGLPQFPDAEPKNNPQPAEKFPSPQPE
ncbi:MAG TPA: TolC family protein [Desulfobulbus sp.]|nr:TolC family protein [Desulfobulbus sp.]HHD63700.1 TolC family protein [Desulfobulbaceae bacterium]